MNGFHLTVLFSITTIILLSNSVVSRLIPIKNRWKVSDNTILECKVFNGAISKCHVKYEPANIYKFTRNPLPASSFKSTTSTTTLMPNKLSSHHGRSNYKQPPQRDDRKSRDHNYSKPKENIHPTPTIGHNIVYCECSDAFCKIDKFIGSHLSECNEHKKGILQKVPSAIKNTLGKVLDKTAKIGKKVVNTVVDSIAKGAKFLIRGSYKTSKLLLKGLNSAARVATSVINVAKKILHWIF